MMNERIERDMPGREPDPLRKDDLVGNAEEEMIFPEELEAIYRLREELPDLRFYTDKFVARFLIACKHHQKNTKIKLERYLLLKRLCGLRTGLLPLYAIDRAPMMVKDVRKPFTIMFRGSKDKKGRLVVWAFQNNRDPDFDYGAALHSPLVWDYLFLDFEMRSYQFTLADFRKPELQIAMNIDLDTYGLSLDYLRFLTFAFHALPFNMESAYDYNPKLIDRIKHWWQIFKLRRTGGMPYREYSVTKGDIKRMIPRCSRLDILGGTVPFNWDFSGYLQSCVAAEGLLLKYWARVRQKFELKDPKILPAKEVNWPKWTRERARFEKKSIAAARSALWRAMKDE